VAQEVDVPMFSWPRVESPSPPVDDLDLTCPACAATGRLLRLLVDPGCRLAQCSTCGTQYLRRPTGGWAPDGSSALATSEQTSEHSADGTESQYWDPYKFVVYESDDVRRGYDARYDLAFQMARAQVGPATSVLDVGCGIGNFLEWARRHGLQGTGVDVDAQAIAVAQSRGLTAGFADDVEALLGNDPTVDVLTLWDVIEHVFDPEAFLGQFLVRLKPGGAILLETPDAAFPVRALLRGLHAASGGRLNMVDTMYYWEHKVYFTEEGLRRLLAAHGCDLLAVRRLPSPRAKMELTFSHVVEDQGSWSHRLLAGAWPVAESVFRHLGRGNKLIALARRRPDVGDRDRPATGSAG
jgi:2-polyprenyl-3-methyl-5-hydroxy-6-metoxy-1,4-benzoquinol methylase